MHARDDNSSSNEDKSDSQEVLFLAMVSKHEPYDNENEEHEEFDNEVEVYFEREFIFARRELKKLIKKYFTIKEQLSKLK